MTAPPDILVLPEGIDSAEFAEACRLHPGAIIIGAVIEKPCCRGILWHQGRNQIDYLKIGTDRRLSEGCGNDRQMPVYETGSACIGVLICMDVNNGVFSSAVINRVRSSGAASKLICVPASMTADWFSDASKMGTPQFDGVHVALCNDAHYQLRCKSFIADPAGMKVAIQKIIEPLHAEI